MIQVVIVLENDRQGEYGLQVDPEEWRKGERAELLQPHSSPEPLRPRSVPLRKE